MIKLRSVTKKYGDFTAVNDLNFTIKPSQITAFLGPNGAGKTTTIKMLVGLINPTHGEVIIGDKTYLTHPIDIKRSISYVPDFPFLYERLTAFEFLNFIADVNEMNQVQANRKIIEQLEVFELEKVKNQLIKSFSHGMKQRLVFCAALLKNPEILIIDEPMVGLDPKTSRIFKDVLKAEALGGKTVFLSTHQLYVAEELAHEVAIINHGKIIKNVMMKELKNGDDFFNLEDYFLKMTNEEKKSDQA